LLVFWLSGLLVVGSFAGALHGLGDSFAVFRHWWVLSLSVSAILLLRRPFQLTALGILAAVLAIAPMIAGYIAPNSDGNGNYSVYQKNLLFKGIDPQAIIDDIQSLAPDFVTLQELSLANRVIFDALAQTYRASLKCRFTGVGSVAVFSRWPMISGTSRCAGDQGIAAMQVNTPEGPVWLVSMHLHWPYPHSQPAQLSRLLPQIEQMDGPVILGGDFNMVPWSHTMRAVQRATGSTRAGPVVRTYIHDSSSLRLPIDHILVPGGRGYLDVRPKLGSDHFGLLLRFDL